MIRRWDEFATPNVRRSSRRAGGNWTTRSAQNRTSGRPVGDPDRRGDPGVGNPEPRLLHTPMERSGRYYAAPGSVCGAPAWILGETGPAFTAVVEALRELLVPRPNDEEALIGPDRSSWLGSSPNSVARRMPNRATGTEPACPERDCSIGSLTYSSGGGTTGPLI
jgi:hypothetical protein